MIAVKKNITRIKKHIKNIVQLEMHNLIEKTCKN